MLFGNILPKRVKVLQFDLNVSKPESQRSPERYPGDGINFANLRVWITADDKEKFLQLVKDKNLHLALWTYFPAQVPGQVNNTYRTVVYPPYPTLRERLRMFTEKRKLKMKHLLATLCQFMVK